MKNNIFCLIICLKNNIFLCYINFMGWGIGNSSVKTFSKSNLTPKRLLKIPQPWHSLLKKRKLTK